MKFSNGWITFSRVGDSHLFKAEEFDEINGWTIGPNIVLSNTGSGSQMVERNTALSSSSSMFLQLVKALSQGKVQGRCLRLPTIFSILVIIFISVTFICAFAVDYYKWSKAIQTV